MTAEQRTQLQHFVPPKYRAAGRLFVAGGYAAAPEHAADLDLWVLVKGEEEVEGVREWVQNYWPLEAESYGIVPPGQDEYEEVPAEDEPDPDGEGWSKRGVHIIGHIYQQPGLPTIQLLTFTADSVTSLLGDFDISTHQVAVDVIEGVRHVTPTTTSVEELPRVVRWTTPKSTMKRLVRLLVRYGHRVVGHPDYARLSGLKQLDDLKPGAVFEEVDDIAA